MQDFLNIDSLLSDDERLSRDTIRRFVDEEVTPLMPLAYEKGEFPHALIKRLADLRIFGMTLPETYGGANANNVVYGLVCKELERGDSGLRSFVSVQNALCIYPIFTFGSDEQKLRFLKPMSDGEVIGCFGLTEPNAGSDPASMRTQATKVKGGYRLNGSKAWITNAPIADLAIVWAKCEGSIQGFIVEKGFKGFSARATHMKGSMRASLTGELFFEDCFVPEHNWLPGTTIGLAAALKCLTQARYGIAWGALGAGEACYEIALEYTKARMQFQKPLAQCQLVQKDLVDMLTRLVQGQLLALHIARLKDKKAAPFEMISMAKMICSRDALEIARMARNLLGANGISLDFHVIRHMANLETVITYEGTDNVHHLILGRHITGLDAF